jgi:hypothetical protein
MTAKIRRAMLLALMLAGAASLGDSCDGPAPLRIFSPASNGQVTYGPLRIELDFLAQAGPETLLVILNGVDITDLFDLAPAPGGRMLAVADFVWDPALGLVQPGANSLYAELRGGVHAQLIGFDAVGEPFADALVSLTPGSGGGFGQSLLPGIVLGPPRGSGLYQGSLDAVSLGLSGSIVLQFTNNVVVDGPGVDLTVFENSFLRLSGLVTQPPFSEPGRVSVSQNGVTWYSFPCNLVAGEAPYHPGCAGVYPVLANAGDPATPHAGIPSDTPIQSLVGQNALTLPVPPGSGGDSFDLAQVGLAWARYVRIESASFVGGPVGADNAGFDLDALAAVRSAPATDANANGIPDAVE